MQENEDGSATVMVGEVENMFRTKGNAYFTLYPDKAWLEIRCPALQPNQRAPDLPLVGQSGRCRQ